MYHWLLGMLAFALMGCHATPKTIAQPKLPPQVSGWCVTASLQAGRVTACTTQRGLCLRLWFGIKRFGGHVKIKSVTPCSFVESRDTPPPEPPQSGEPFLATIPESVRAILGVPPSRFPPRSTKGHPHDSQSKILR